MAHWLTWLIHVAQRIFTPCFSRSLTIFTLSDRNFCAVNSLLKFVSRRPVSLFVLFSHRCSWTSRSCDRQVTGESSGIEYSCTAIGLKDGLPYENLVFTTPFFLAGIKGPVISRLRVVPIFPQG